MKGWIYISQDLRWWTTSEEADIDGRCALAEVITQVDEDGQRRRYRRIDAPTWAHLRKTQPAETLAPIRARLVELHGPARVELAEAA